MACLHANAGEQEPYSQPVGHLQLPCTQPCSAQALLPLLLFLYELLALWGPAVVLSWSRKVAFAEWSDELPLFLVVRSCSFLAAMTVGCVLWLLSASTTSHVSSCSWRGC
nr:uncharacterized protein LOC116650057 isoform X2 [Drosophila virilis]